MVQGQNATGEPVGIVSTVPSVPAVKPLRPIGRITVHRFLSAEDFCAAEGLFQWTKSRSLGRSARIDWILKPVLNFNVKFDLVYV